MRIMESLNKELLVSFELEAQILISILRPVSISIGLDEVLKLKSSKTLVVSTQISTVFNAESAEQ